MQNKWNLFFYISILNCIFFSLLADHPPKLTVVFVIDQCPLHALIQLKTHLKYGIKTLLTDGTIYTNAHHPHGMPATCTGHTALNTGAYANEHGIVGNRWYNEQGKKITCDAGDQKNDAVLSPQGVYEVGKSPNYIMVDGISDQFMLNNTPEVPHHVYSISLKSRAAIATANRTNAIWFDGKSGRFTSSKAYFETLPEWLESYNKNNTIPIPSTIEWKQLYDNDSGAYGLSSIHRYKSARRQQIINTTLPISLEVNPNNPCMYFDFSPLANKNILDCTKACIQHHISKDKPDRLLVWVCLSSLDKIGHRFGPWSKEYLDMIYWLDKDIGSFSQSIHEIVNKKDVLYILTSDHGTPPIIDNAQKKGLKNIGGIVDAKQLLQKINEYIEQTFGIKDMVYATGNHHLYFNPNQLQQLSTELKTEVIEAIKLMSEMNPLIKKAWTPHTLLKRTFPFGSMEFSFQQQLYPNRSGNIVLQMHPYSIIMAKQKGTSHRTPHTYNTRVPMVFYRHDVIKPQQIHSRVSTLQLANTLAQLLNVPQPSSSYADVLSEVFEK